jgi:hypothetical protein
MSLLDTLLEVSSMLEIAEIPYVIGGSLASSIWGQQRTTHDADLAIFLDELRLQVLESLVKWPYTLDSESIRISLADLSDFASGQILHGETLDKIDLFLLSPHDLYAESQFKHLRMVELAPHRKLPFASPEDTVITKLRWFNLGNRVSDRQWNDIVQVLEIQDGSLDEAYLEKWATHFDLLDLLREAQSQVIR